MIHDPLALLIGLITGALFLGVYLWQLFHYSDREDDEDGSGG